MLVLGVTPEEAPDEGEYVTHDFRGRYPEDLKRKRDEASARSSLKLNKLGGKHGIGIADIVENRVVGMKSRGVYETPGGTILMAAHEQLEELILDRDTYGDKEETRQPVRTDRIRRKMVHTAS